MDEPLYAITINKTLTFLLFREVESEGSVKPGNPNVCLEGANLSE